MSFPPEPIAIIGSGCRFPGGVNTPFKLWELLRKPRDLLQKIPPNRRFHPETYFHDNPEHHGNTNVQASHFLEEDPVEFDNGFFNIQPAESEAVKLQQRLLSETIYDALCAGGQTLEAHPVQKYAFHTRSGLEQVAGIDGLFPFSPPRNACHQDCHPKLEQCPLWTGVKATSSIATLSNA